MDVLCGNDLLTNGYGTNVQYAYPIGNVNGNWTVRLLNKAQSFRAAGFRLGRFGRKHSTNRLYINCRILAAEDIDSQGFLIPPRRRHFGPGRLRDRSRDRGENRKGWNHSGQEHKENN